MAVSRSALTYVGSNLHRPECVLATADGRLHVSDWRGGVTVIGPDGHQDTVIARDHQILRPNGIALDQDGSYLLAHLGATAGGVFRLAPDGRSQCLLAAVDDVPLPPANFPLRDHQGRLWVTVSTRTIPRADAYRPDTDDGFIVCVDDRGARIAVDNLGYTNECWVDPTGTTLFVNETFARRLTRFTIRPDGTLTDRSTLATFGPGTFPDGLAVDADGWFWITSIVNNQVIRVAPDGRRQHVVFEDADPDHVAWVEDAFVAGTMGRPHLDTAGTSRAANISSLAFGDPHCGVAYLGCLLGRSIATLSVDVAGHPPVHWSVTRGVGADRLSRSINTPVEREVRYAGPVL